VEVINLLLYNSKWKKRNSAFLCKNSLKRLFYLLSYFKNGNVMNKNTSSGSLKYKQKLLLRCSEVVFSNTKRNFRFRKSMLGTLLNVLSIARSFFKPSMFSFHQKIAPSFSYKTLSVKTHEHGFSISFAPTEDLVLPVHFHQYFSHRIQTIRRLRLQPSSTIN
jgi:hypothetical protein